MGHDPAESDAGVTTDEALVRAVGAGDMEALRQLAVRHQRSVRRLALHLLRDPHDADDVVQEVFLRVHRAAARYEARQRFTPWLKCIVVNLCRDRLRRARRRGASLDASPHEPPLDAPADPLERRETILRVRRAIDELPQRQRTALILHRYEQLSHREIAEATGWSASAVESLLVRAYQNLRQSLADLM